MRESSESTLPFSLSERRRIAPLTSPTKTRLLNLRAKLSVELDAERCDLRRDFSEEVDEALSLQHIEQLTLN